MTALEIALPCLLPSLLAAVKLDKNSCKVSLDLEFEFSSFSVGLVSNQLFTSVANNLVDALSTRAKEIYG